MVTVVCTGGEAPPEHLCAQWFSLADRTVAADGGLALLRRAGRRADLWIGDGDSLSGAPEGWRSWAEEVRLLDRAKDDSDTEAAVRTVLAGEVWLVGGAGGRMDHWWANLRLFAAENRMTRWLTAHETASRLGPGRSVSVSAGPVSVFPLGPGPWRAGSSGLRWPLDGVDFRVWHSLSNEAGPEARLTASEGSFLVLQPHRPEDLR